jgi:hypothetical protein
MTKRIKKRSKFETILLLPLLIPVFIIGWALYQLGYSKPRTRQLVTPYTSTCANNLVFTEPQE